MAPLFNNPDYLFLTLDEALNSVTDNDITEGIDIALIAARNVVDPGGVLELAVEYVNEEISNDLIPVCTIPRNTKSLLDMALITQIDLDKNNLMIIEMLKLYQYFSGNDHYLQYEKELDTQIREMHLTLSKSVTNSLSPIFSSFAVVDDLSTNIEKYSERFSGVEFIARPLVKQFSNLLALQRIDTNLSVKEVFSALNLELNPYGVNQQATIADLRVVMSTQLIFDNKTLSLRSNQQRDLRSSTEQNNLANLPLDLLLRLASNQLEPIRQTLTLNLLETLRPQIGVVNSNETMAAIFLGYIARHVDLSGSIAALAKKTIGLLMSKRAQTSESLLDYVPLANSLDLADRASQGDCVAGWRLYLQAAEVITKVWAEPASETFSITEVALGAAYNKAIDYAIDMVVQELTSLVFSEMDGSFETITSRMKTTQKTFTLTDLTSLTPEKTIAAVLNKEVAFVIREEFDLLNPRRVSLLIFDPLDSLESKKEIMLGLWGVVDYVHSMGDIILIGGQYQLDNRVQPVAMFIDLRGEEPAVSIIPDALLASAETMKLSVEGNQIILTGPLGVQLIPLIPLAQ